MSEDNHQKNTEAPADDTCARTTDSSERAREMELEQDQALKDLELPPEPRCCRKKKS